MTIRVYLDASVLVAMFTTDALTARADRFLQNTSYMFAVGTFASAEFSSAVGRKVRMATMDAADAFNAFSTFDIWAGTGPERVALTPADVEDADRFPRQFDLKLRVGDALHLAMTQRLGLPLVTFDLGMARAAALLGVALVPC